MSVTIDSHLTKVLYHHAVQESSLYRKIIVRDSVEVPSCVADVAFSVNSDTVIKHEDFLLSLNQSLIKFWLQSVPQYVLRVYC